jgi:two-component system, NtrC family, sensor histidine kinase PilS
MPSGKRLLVDGQAAASEAAPAAGRTASFAENTLVGLEASRQDAVQTVTYLMLFRVAVATMLMLSVVAVAVTSDNLDTLAGPFGRFVFSLLATTYVATLAYAVNLRRLADPVRFAYVQIAVDLALITLLVHATGGAQSAYTFLYLIDVVAAALLPRRFGVILVAVTSAVLMIGTSLVGYFRLVPPITGQTVFPWDLTHQEVLFRLVVFLGGVVSVGALGATLSTQTRRASERLARHQQMAGDLALLHQNTIRCLSSGLVTVTLEGAITSINEAACEILAVGELTALGQPLATRIPKLKPVLDEAGPVGSVRRHEVDAIRADGTVRRLGVSATPLSDHSGEVIGRVIHFQDLTELRRMEIAVQRSERLASIGRLAAGIAHEIRNPLASISGSVEILKSLPGASTETRQLVDIAVREVDRLDRLISDLLVYARPRTEDKQALDLGEVASEIAMAFEAERRERNVVVVVDAEPGVEMEGASGQIRQVLWNLIRNATEAMPDGGTIRIATAREELTGGQRESVLSVTDDGVGIPREDLDRIFEPFFSTKPTGTGLGLATVARIVEDHRGTVDTHSELGKGTVFTLRFPTLSG